MESHAAHAHDHEMPTEGAALTGVAVSATLHCLTGCAIGEVAGVAIGTAAGFSDVATIALAIALAFLFGYALTSLPLLRAGLAISAVIGIALASDTLSIATMEVIDNAIVLSVMRFADEVVDRTKLPFPPAKEVRKAELEMAKALVNSLAADWDPEKYTDEYRENLMRIIKAKMKGKTVELEAQEEPRQAEVIDLMERLRRSLEQSGGAKGRTKSRSGRPGIWSSGTYTNAPVRRPGLDSPSALLTTPTTVHHGASGASVRRSRAPTGLRPAQIVVAICRLTIATGVAPALSVASNPRPATIDNPFAAKYPDDTACANRGDPASGMSVIPST